MRVWIDGVLTDEDSARVSVYDHGLTVGDGVFESVKVVDGRPFALSRHLDRLGRSLRGLGLPEIDREWLRGGVTELLADGGDLSFARLRITVTGGVSPLGSHRGQAEPTVIVAVAPLGPRDETCDVVVVPWSRNEHGALAGLKTTSYAENVVALAQAEQRGAQEAVLPNTAGDLCEATGSNIFLRHRGRLITPPLSAGCLAGVTRSLVLEWVGAVEETVPVSALAGADEAFLTSTTREVKPIACVDGYALAAAPGPVTRDAMSTFAKRAAGNPDP